MSSVVAICLIFLLVSSFCIKRSSSSGFQASLWPRSNCSRASCTSFFSLEQLLSRVILRSECDFCLEEMEWADFPCRVDWTGLACCSLLTSSSWASFSFSSPSSSRWEGIDSRSSCFSPSNGSSGQHFSPSGLRSHRRGGCLKCGWVLRGEVQNTYGLVKARTFKVSF